jgi:hypothetical protein
MKGRIKYNITNKLAEKILDKWLPNYPWHYLDSFRKSGLSDKEKVIKAMEEYHEARKSSECDS